MDKMRKLSNIVLSLKNSALISLYSINWLIWITETECLLRGTDWVNVLLKIRAVKSMEITSG